MAKRILTISRISPIDKNNQILFQLTGLPTEQKIKTTILQIVNDKNIAERLSNAIRDRLSGNQENITKKELTTILHNINIDIQQQQRFDEMTQYIKTNYHLCTSYIYPNRNTLMHMLYEKKDMFSETQLKTLTNMLYNETFYKERLNGDGKTVLDLAPEELKESLIYNGFITYKQLFIRNIKKQTLDKDVTKFASMELWFKGVSTDNPPPIYSVLLNMSFSFSDIVCHVVLPDLPDSVECSSDEQAIQLVKSHLFDDNKQELQRIGLILQRIKVCLHTMGLYLDVMSKESRRRQFVSYMDELAQYVKDIFVNSHDV